MTTPPPPTDWSGELDGGVMPAVTERLNQLFTGQPYIIQLGSNTCEFGWADEQPFKVVSHPKGPMIVNARHGVMPSWQNSENELPFQFSFSGNEFRYSGWVDGKFGSTLLRPAQAASGDIFTGNDARLAADTAGALALRLELALGTEAFYAVTSFKPEQPSSGRTSYIQQLRLPYETGKQFVYTSVGPSGGCLLVSNPADKLHWEFDADHPGPLFTFSGPDVLVMVDQPHKRCCYQPYPHPWCFTRLYRTP